MDHAAITTILDKYSIKTATILDSQKGYRNVSHPIVLPSGTTINLILYKSEPGILRKVKNANFVSNFSASHKLPTRHTIDARIIKLQAGNNLKYGALYNYLPGNTIAWEAYSMEHLKNLGKAMGELHAVLKRCPMAAIPNVTKEYLKIYARMSVYFADTNVQSALAQKLHLGLPWVEHYKKILRLCNKLPNQQVLHMDFVRGNILFEDTQVSGIIDFEKTAVGHPLFDIARTLAFLLVDCAHKDEAQIRKYFLLSGYGKRGPARPQYIVLNDMDLLEQLIDLFLLYDFYKFLRHNPYEYLLQNHHFIRTRALLLQRSIIFQTNP